MLSIAKLRVGQEAYQLSGIAESLDGYYTGAGEATGQWAGHGALALGLSGEVAPDDLRALLAGIAPGTGGLSPNGETIRPHARRVPGFDLTFKAPKSVSVLFAVTDDPRVQHAIVEAGERAVVETLGWLEREVVHVRRGTGNERFLTALAATDPQAAEAARIRSVPAKGLVAAMFRHRTSRAGDPLLHWHTLIANLAEGPDGRWTSIVHPDIYRAVRTAGEVFQAVLRDELTDRLGVGWRAGRHVPEIAGVPQRVLDVFSKRSKEIEDWLADTGTIGDRAGRQRAVLATRRAKPEVEHQRFDAAWKIEAEAFGWGPDAAERLLVSLEPPTRLAIDVDDEWIVDVLRSLTDHDATFERNDLVRAVAARLYDGAPLRQIERTVAAVLASDYVVPVADAWTSAELVNVERSFLNAATTRRGMRDAVNPAVVSRALAAFPTLGADQRTAIEQLAGSPDGVMVLVGPAGTGKTFTLDAVHSVYENAGYRVIGAAPSAKAAHELEHGAHIASATIHRRLASWQHGYDRPGPDTLLVVDEAAMAGTRDLEAIVSATVAAGGRVLLAGDHHQLPEVTAGGGFAALVAGRMVTTATLTTNRRQTEPWERDALAELRDGQVATAVEQYRNHGRVDVTADRSAMIDSAVEQWLAARADGHDAVLLAGTNATVRSINEAVRSRLFEAGELGSECGTWSGRQLAVGDKVVLRVNDYQTRDAAGDSAPLLNGHTAVVTGSTLDGLVVRLDHADTKVAIPAAYLQAGGVDHGYAFTTHRAQGGTWDVAITVGTEGLARESGYLALSRGRFENRLIVTQPELDQLNDEMVRHDSALLLLDEEPDDNDLVRVLNQRRNKTLALTIEPNADVIARLATGLDLITLETHAGSARRAEQLAETITGVTPAQVRATIDRSVHTASHLSVGCRVKPVDRNNVGTVSSIDDRTGAAVVQFVSEDGRHAERRFGWDEIAVLERHSQPRLLNRDAQAAVDAIVAGHHDSIDRWNQVMARESFTPDDPHIYGTAARTHIDRAAARLTATHPEWLHVALGDRPKAPAAAQVWDDAVRDVAAIVARHDGRSRAVDYVGQLLAPTGPYRPEQAVERLAVARAWLDQQAEITSVVLRHRTPVELIERRTELDAIMSTAPADTRRLVDALAANQLSLDGILDAVDTGSRRRWILEHWPHVVEAAMVEQTMPHAPVASVRRDKVAHGIELDL